MKVSNNQEAEHTQETAALPHGGRRQLPGMLEVNVNSTTAVGCALEQAIETITETAKHHGIGVLVTCVGADSYIVRAHPGVPYGHVRQESRP